MVHKIIIDIHRSAVQVDRFPLFGGIFREFVPHLARTVVSVAQFYTVTPMGSHIDTLMALRQAAITKKHTWIFKIFMKYVIRGHVNVERYLCGFRLPP